MWVLSGFDKETKIPLNLAMIDLLGHATILTECQCAFYNDLFMA